MEVETGHKTGKMYTFMKISHWRWICLGIFFIGFSFGQQGPGFSAYKEGETYRKANDCNQAIAKYNEAISLEPTNFRYYVRKGQCLIQLKRYDEAIQAFEQAVNYNKNFSQGYIMIAKLALQQKDYAKAIQYLEKAYQNEGDANKKIVYKSYVVKLLIRENRASDALNSLQQLKQDIPEAAQDPRVLSAEGDIYGAMQRWDQAIQSYQLALNRVASLPKEQKARYYFQLGRAYYESGDTKKADEIWANVQGTRYEKAVKALKLRSGPKYNIAVAQGYYKAKAFDEALEQINQAIPKAKEPSDIVLVYQFQGMVYYQKGQLQQAITAFAKAAQTETDPSKKTKLYNLMIKLQFANGDYNGALETANKILQAQPNNHAILFSKAQAEYQLGNYSAAVASLERAIANAPQNRTLLASYNFLLGMAAKKAGDVNRADKAFKEANVPPFKYAAMEELKKLRQRQ